MISTQQTIEKQNLENLTLNITQEIQVRASLDAFSYVSRHKGMAPMMLLFAVIPNNAFRNYAAKR